MKRFPIQQAGTIPWDEAAKAYDEYESRYGTYQSLERLAERGGFGVLEFCALYLRVPAYDRQLSNIEGACRIVARVAALLGERWQFSHTTTPQEPGEG